MVQKRSKSNSCESHKRKRKRHSIFFKKLKVIKLKVIKATINRAKIDKLKTNKAILNELKVLRGRVIDLESERIVLSGLEISPRYASARKVSRETMITAPFQFSETNINYLSPAVLNILDNESLNSNNTLFPVENLSISLRLNNSVGQVKSLEGLGLIVYMVPILDSEIIDFYALNFETTIFDKVNMDGSVDLINYVFFDTVISNNNGSALLTNGNTVLTIDEMDAIARQQKELIPIPMKEGELCYNQIYTFLRTEIEPIESKDNLILSTLDPAILPRTSSSFLASEF